jgi:hypothetical protein
MRRGVLIFSDGTHLLEIVAELGERVQVVSICVQECVQAIPLNGKHDEAERTMTMGVHRMRSSEGHEEWYVEW